MLTLFRPSALKTPRPQYRPEFEALERRDCPALALMFDYSFLSGREIAISGYVTGNGGEPAEVAFSGAATAEATTDADGWFEVIVEADTQGQLNGIATGSSETAVSWVQVQNSPAYFMDFTAVRVSGNQWALSGWVSDEAPDGLVVMFSGLPSVEGKQAVVSADGSFSLTVTLAAGETGLITASVADGWMEHPAGMDVFVDP